MYSFIHRSDSEIRAITERKYIFQYLMTFDPENFGNSKSSFEIFEHLRDAMRGIGFDRIDESIVDRPFHIRFSYTDIGRCETCTHEHLTEVWVEGRHL